MLDLPDGKGDKRNVSPWEIARTSHQVLATLMSTLCPATPLLTVSLATMISLIFATTSTATVRNIGTTTNGDIQYDTRSNDGTTSKTIGGVAGLMTNKTIG